MLDDQHTRFSCIAFTDTDIFTVQNLFTNFMVRALNANGNISETMCFECIDCPATDSAETENNGLTLIAVMAIDAPQVQCMQNSAVPCHFVVFIECVPSDLTGGAPNKHILKRDQGQFAVDRGLSDGALLGAVGIAPKYAALFDLLQIA